MKRKIKKLLVRYALTGFFVFLFCASYQFVIWKNGPWVVNELMQGMSFSSPDGYRQTKEYLYRELGLDRPFIPHLWIFDSLFIRDN